MSRARACGAVRGLPCPPPAVRCTAFALALSRQTLGPLRKKVVRAGVHVLPRRARARAHWHFAAADRAADRAARGAVRGAARLPASAAAPPPQAGPPAAPPASAPRRAAPPAPARHVYDETEMRAAPLPTRSDSSSRIRYIFLKCAGAKNECESEWPIASRQSHDRRTKSRRREDDCERQGRMCVCVWRGGGEEVRHTAPAG